MTQGVASLALGYVLLGFQPGIDLPTTSLALDFGFPSAAYFQFSPMSPINAQTKRFAAPKFGISLGLHLLVDSALCANCDKSQIIVKTLGLSKNFS